MDRLTQQHAHAAQLTQHRPAGEEGLSRTAPTTATAAASCLVATAVAAQLQNKAQQQRVAHNDCERKTN